MALKTIKSGHYLFLNDKIVTFVNYIIRTESKYYEKVDNHIAGAGGF